VSEAIEKVEKKRKRVVGEVVSNRMNATIVVRVSRRVRHPKYHKIITVYKRFYVHDENGDAKSGDRVRIVSSRPISKLKRWRLEEVLTRAEAEVV